MVVEAEGKYIDVNEHWQWMKNLITEDAMDHNKWTKQIRDD